MNPLNIGDIKYKPLSLFTNVFTGFIRHYGFPFDPVSGHSLRLGTDIALKIQYDLTAFLRCIDFYCDTPFLSAFNDSLNGPFKA